MIDHTKRISDARGRLYCREQFAACVATTDANLDLASAALWLAAEEYPELDPQIYVGRLESLAERVRVAWSHRSQSYAALDALRSVLVEEQNFGGSSYDYYDPRNSFLNEVLERRVGIPISLSVVWIEVARRAGIPIEGVNMPGHFIVRMLNNLRLVYVETEDYGRALSVVDRIALITGDTPKLRRDRGLLFARLQIYGKAWADLAAYLGSDDAPESANEEVSLLREHLERVRQLAGAPN